MTVLDDLKMQYKTGGVANRLIYWNVGCFLVSLVLFYSYQTGVFIFPSWAALSSEPLEVIRAPWTILTYAFLHDGFWHLFFNMMVLNFSARLFETFFTQKQLLGVYLLGGMFAGVVFVLSYYLLHENVTVLVGASAAIMAVLVAVTTYQPLMRVQLLFLGSVSLWHVTAVVLLLDVMQIRLDNTGGQISHLAGALFGFLYIRLLLAGTDLSRGVNVVLDGITGLFDRKPKTPFKKVHVNPKKPTAAKASRIVTKDKEQQQIDEILDKISQSGYDSLTKEEKEFLFKAGK